MRAPIGLGALCLGFALLGHARADAPSAPAASPTTTDADPDAAGRPSPAEILARVDRNLFVADKIILHRMIVANRRGQKRTLKARSWVVGVDKAFSEYLAPHKEAGTKMLKVGKNLWTYSPRSDRIIHIAGHLLRQPVMGSDLSYEDSLEEAELSKVYDAVGAEAVDLDGRPVWLLTLDARTDGVAYPRKKLWVDRERSIPLRQEWFAKSGKLLKTVAVRKVERLEGRWYPTVVLFKDALQSGQGTEFAIDEIDFDARIPDRLFSRQSLRR